MSLDLVARVERSIEQRGLFGGERRVLVGVSGGLDSMVLLRVLSVLAERHGWVLGVAHLNHRLRGNSSNADERLVRRTAEKLGLACVTEGREVAKWSKEEGLSLEMGARRLRHEFLSRAARELGMKVMALGHHADDQVELFFLRLLRGASSEGLSGMEWRGVSSVDRGLVLVRPLLDVRRGELEEFARAEGVKFRVDASNVEQEVLRNRVRHELVPLLEGKYQAGLSRVILRQMEILGSEGELVDELASGWLAGGAKREGFGKLPVAVQRRVIYRQLMDLGVAGDFELVEGLRLEPGKRVMVSEGVTVCRLEQGGVRLMEKAGEVGFEAGELRIELGRGGSVEWAGVKLSWDVKRVVGRFSVPSRTVGSEVLDMDKVGEVVILRHWRAGDRFWPIGMRGAVKLQDLFTNEKVPRVKRRKLLIMTRLDGEIVWVEDMRLGERFKLDKTTRQRLKWSWDRL